MFVNLRVVDGSFLSTLSLRRATYTMTTTICTALFLSTLSLRRATCPLFFSCWLLAHFYPRSPCGERRHHWHTQQYNQLFLSTLSLRRATYVCQSSRCGWLISIHALLAESDVHYDNYNLHCVISIHALLAESDKIPNQRKIDQKNFYPRSPCGERHETTPDRVSETLISIHALLAESDCYAGDCTATKTAFLSTLSLRRATTSSTVTVILRKNFYPRSPCGERLMMLLMVAIPILFLSTLSLRRATG